MIKAIATFFGIFFLSFTIQAQTCWKAKWIAIGYNEDTVTRPAQYFKKVFTINQPIKKAQLLITSRGLYEARLNSNKIGMGYLTPGWTSYNKRLQYQQYAVNNQLIKGSNELVITLGNGWYRGYIGWEGKDNIYGNQLALLCQLELTYANGKKDTIISDESWICGEGPVLDNDLLHGETFDANRVALFQHPVRLLNDGYTGLVPNDGVTVTTHETFTPQLIITPKGEQVLDFGQNLTGWVRVKVRGNKGDTIRLLHGEVLDPNGNFYNANMRSAKAAATYVLCGRGEETFTPRFSYFGFRYVKLAGITGTVNPADFTAVALYANMQPTGTFACSNPLLNQLHHNIVWGQKSNFTDVPTDCPQRDEKLGWTGDAQAFSRTATFNFDVKQFFSKWLNDLSLDQLPNGRVTHVVPDILAGVGGSAGWSDAATIIPWTMYEVYGDTALLRRQYPSMKAWVAYISSQSKNDLWNTGIHYGDWLSYRSTANREYTAHTDMYLIAQAFYAYSTNLLLKAAIVLNKEDDIKTYTILLEKVKAAFCREYVTPNGMLASNTQTAYTLALQFDLLPEDRRAEAARRLVKNIELYKYHITTGFIGTPYICHVLSRFGYTDVAYQLLLQETYPSWLYPVKMGATTIWERWDGIRPDGSLQNPGMNSFNHYAYGAVGDWMYQHILGIQADAAGYKTIIIHPLPGGNITWAKGSYASVSGKISVDWKIENGKFIMEVVIPQGTTATVFVPANDLKSYKKISGVQPGLHQFKGQ